MPPTFYNLLSLYCASTAYWGSAKAFAGKTGASVIDLLANSKIRFDSVERMTQSQNTSWSFAETKGFRVVAREHTLAPPGRHRP